MNEAEKQGGHRGREEEIKCKKRKRWNYCRVNDIKEVVLVKESVQSWGWWNPISISLLVLSRPKECTVGYLSSNMVFAESINARQEWRPLSQTKISSSKVKSSANCNWKRKQNTCVKCYYWLRISYIKFLCALYEFRGILHTKDYHFLAIVLLFIVAFIDFATRIAQDAHISVVHMK